MAEVRERAHCGAHERYRARCQLCGAAEYAAMVARDFPPALVDPWRERVAGELPEWQASMRPLSMDSDEGRPYWTLERRGGGRPGEWWRMELAGSDQDRLLEAARRFDSRRIT